MSNPFKPRPIDEVSLRDLLDWRAKAIASEWSPYTVAAINAECDRRTQRTGAAEKIYELNSR